MLKALALIFALALPTTAIAGAATDDGCCPCCCDSCPFEK
jgi:hypothetical protein